MSYDDKRKDERKKDEPLADADLKYSWVCPEPMVCQTVEASATNSKLELTATELMTATCPKVVEPEKKDDKTDDNKTKTLRLLQKPTRKLDDKKDDNTDDKKDDHDHDHVHSCDGIKIQLVLEKNGRKYTHDVPIKIAHLPEFTTAGSMTWLIILIVVLVLALAVGGGLYWRNNSQKRLSNRMIEDK